MAYKDSRCDACVLSTLLFFVMGVEMLLKNVCRVLHSTHGGAVLAFVFVRVRDGLQHSNRNAKRLRRRRRRPYKRTIFAPRCVFRAAGGPNSIDISLSTLRTA